jgi:hypothetical protein
MIVAALSVDGTLKPSLSVHGDVVKINLGVLLIEADRQTFKDMITDLIQQALRFDIEMP